MIRPATREDIPIVERFILADFDQRGWESQSGLQADPYSIDALLRFHVERKDSEVFVHETDGAIDGYLVGQLLPFHLDIRKVAAHEKISGGTGKEELWETFIKWARERGAMTAVIGCYDVAEGPRLRRIV